MVKILKYGAIVSGVLIVYLAGYHRAETEGELRLETLKREQAQAIVEAQLKEKERYEKEIAKLVASLNSARSERDKRVRELEQFRSTSRDLETCHRERNDLASLAVRGEELLQRSLHYLESCQGGR